MQLHHTFLKDLQETIDNTEFQRSIIKKCFKIASFEVCMYFASSVLAEKMTLAFEHLEQAKCKAPDLTIFLWDDYVQNPKTHPFQWSTFSYKKQSLIIKQLNAEKMYASYNVNTLVLNVFDQESKTAYFWVSDAAKLPSSELSTPLKNILHKFLLSKDVYLVHAGAVGTASGGVLLVGKGGVGKSTSTLTCLDSELLYAGDDYVLVGKGVSPAVYPLYSSAKLHRENIKRVSHVSSAIADEPYLKHEKAHIFLNKTWPEKLASQFPLRAIFLPHVTGKRNTELTPATMKDAVHALTLSTVLQLPQTDPRAVKELIKIIQCVPSYHLNLGTEMKQIPQIILKFLKNSNYE